MIFIKVSSLTKLGGSFWETPLQDVLGIRVPGVPDFLQEMPLNHCYLVIGGLMLGFNIIQRFYLPLVLII